MNGGTTTLHRVDEPWPVTDGAADAPLADVVVFPLSFAQERLWFLDQFESGQAVYNIPTAFRLDGPLDVAALERSLNEIVARHEALRTTFVTVRSTPMQRVAPPGWTALPVIELRALPEWERTAEEQRLMVAEARRPFDLGRGPLLRATLVRATDDRATLLVTMHHIVSEGGWSMGVYLRELGAVYAAFAAGRPSPLPPLPIQYGDYAVWQREWLCGEALERQLTYWTTRLAGAPAVLELPTDHPRPAMQSSRGATHTLVVPQAVATALRALSRAEGATLFMTLMAAWQTLLFRYSGQPDVVVGTPVAGRVRPELEGLVGLFVNTLAVRTDLAGDPSFRELLHRVRKAAMGAYSHQDLPFERLVEALQPERSLSYSPLFQVMFSFQNVPQHPLGLAGVTVTPLEVDSGTAMFDLTLFMWEREDGLQGVLEYNTDLYSEATVARLAGHFGTLLRGIADDPGRRLSALPLLADAERHQLVREWNDTAQQYPQDRGVHELFEAQAARTPDAVAVVHEDASLTYAELDLRANRLAHYLRARGLGPGGLAGICVARSLDMLVGLLAILKAGGAYVPLDPAYPAERVAGMLEDSGAPVLLTQAALVPRLPSFRGLTVLLDADRDAIDAEAVVPPSPHTDPPPFASAEQLAYVIYTSGSTGRPKGVQITHRNVVNFLSAMQRELRPGADDTLLAVTTLSFDIAGLELWLPLAVGARVVLVSREVAVDGARLAEALDRSGATLMQATPVTWQLLLQAGWRGSQRLTILCGGEALPRELVAPLRERSAALWNLYGPTETTIWSTVHHVEADPGPGEAVSIGRPIANTQVYVLDGDGGLAPLCVAGELYIGGDGVARGYLHRPELTAERFVPDPFAPTARAVGGTSAAPARLYRTGDMARWRADGTLECLGRLDQQVKLRGFRIELGEIEAVLARHPCVGACAVVVREDTPGDKRLVAYVVPAADPAPSAAELREHVQAQVPDYMVPAAFVMLEALPLTPNKKVDRRALPAPESDAFAMSAAAAAPCDREELQLVMVWEEVLGVRGIGVHDNFFDLGGHSLLAVRLFAELYKVTGRHLPLATLFQAPTVAEFAAVLRQDGWTAPWSPLVTLQRGDAGRTALFLVHAIGGNVLNYRPLALRLGAAQPVYGLQAVGLDGSQPPHTRVEDMAAEYIAAIRAVQPAGPYSIGGSSFGGVVGFEMARQLRAAGEQVALLALLDSFPILRDHTKHATGVRAAVRRVAVHANHHARALLTLPPREKLAYVRGRLASLRGRVGGQARAAEPPLAVALRSVKRADYLAHRAYDPAPYEGPVTLFRTCDWQLEGETDPTAGWGEWAAEVEVHEVPGDHRSMLKEPHVAVLADRLAGYLGP